MKRIVGTLGILLLIGIAAGLRLSAQQDDQPKRENLGPNINTETSESVPVLSPDGKTLYFKRVVPAKREDQEVDNDIYVSTLQRDGTWSPARDVGRRRLCLLCLLRQQLW